MKTVQEILSAIEKLSPSERDELLQALHDFSDDHWDRQIASDAKSGKLDQLLKSADEKIDAANNSRRL